MNGTIKSNGQTLYWESHGEGTPLILVMGIGYDATLWGLHQIPFFSKHFQTIAFDNRDVGRSSQATGPYTIADMADDVAGLLDTALRLEKDSVLFYRELLDEVDEKDAPAVQEIIDEEKRHVRALVKAKRELSQ